MATKTISILEDAYQALLREKDEDESFSDVILKLTRRNGKIADSLGKWKMTEEEANKIQKELKKAWENFGEHKWNA